MVVSTLKKNNVKISGNPNSNQTIVFGHGFGTDHHVWRFISHAFIGEFRIVTYDNVGANDAVLATYNQSRYSKIDSYADDLVDLCDELQIRDAIYVGHSVSGMVGLLASQKAPEFFKKHVFINASPRYLNDDDYIGGFNQSDLDDLYQGMTNNYFAWAGGFASYAMGNPQNPKLADELARTLSAVRPDIAWLYPKSFSNLITEKIWLASKRNRLLSNANETLLFHWKLVNT